MYGAVVDVIETGSKKGSEFLDQPTESPRLIVHTKIQALRAGVRRNVDLSVIDRRHVMSV